MPRKAKENTVITVINNKNKKSKEEKKVKKVSKASKKEKVPASKVKSKKLTSKTPTKKETKISKKANSTKKTASKTKNTVETVSKSKGNSKVTSKVKSNTKTTSKPKSSAKSDSKLKNSIKTTPKTKSSTKTTSNSNSKKSVTPKNNKKAIVSSVEYYDLPYRYNQTVVKILAQTPKMLFIYWDISDKDRKTFIDNYGEDFFNNTKPVLLIHNQTNNYTFEVEINDFANSWYLHINDTSCNYSIELGRRPIQYNEKLNTDYVYVTSSNVIETPNDHILFDKNQNMVYFKNTKTNMIIERKLTSLSFLRNMGKIYNIYDLYKQIYKDEIILDNPSSGNPTSNNPTSKFK